MKEEKNRKTRKRKGFTAREVELIRKNQWVSSVTALRITYREEFKHEFVELYNAGKKPAEIFRLYGFDTVLLGNKRIERASHRWRKEFGEKD